MIGQTQMPFDPDGEQCGTQTRKASDWLVIYDEDVNAVDHDTLHTPIARH